MIGLWIGTLSSSGASAKGDFESVATVTVGPSGLSSVTFSSIPNTYQHLQIRGVWRQAQNLTNESLLLLRMNGDSTSSNYACRSLNNPSYYSTATASTSLNRIGYGPKNSQLAGAYSAITITILDYNSTTKTKVARASNGYATDSVGIVALNSVLWNSTSAVTSLTLLPEAAGETFKQYTQFALYGMRA
jgi:hypothetical protein